MTEELACGACNRVGQFTQPVSVIVLFAPRLDRPYPLIPAEDYRVCGACEAVFTLIDRAADAHPLTKSTVAGPWSRAVIVFMDGHGVDVRAQRRAQPAPLLH